MQPLTASPVPEFIDPVFVKTSPKRSLLVIENERFGLVFAKTGTKNSGTVNLMYTVKEKGGKPDRKPQPLPYGIRNQYRNLRTLKIMPRNLNEIIRS
jgi:hypothetical protein